MIITKIVKKNEKGELEVTFALTEQQTHVLMEYAINSLVALGLLQFLEKKEEMAEPGVPAQLELPLSGNLTLEEAMADIMKNAKPGDLPQA